MTEARRETLLLTDLWVVFYNLIYSLWLLGIVVVGASVSTTESFQENGPRFTRDLLTTSTSFNIGHTNVLRKKKLNLEPLELKLET